MSLLESRRWKTICKPLLQQHEDNMHALAGASSGAVNRGPAVHTAHWQTGCIHHIQGWKVTPGLLHLRNDNYPNDGYSDSSPIFMAMICVLICVLLLLVDHHA
eukprot:scaffold304560_cov18-Prasinocladus_malaysianus.AAC.1